MYYVFTGKSILIKLDSRVKIKIKYYIDYERRPCGNNFGTRDEDVKTLLLITMITSVLQLIRNHIKVSAECRPAEGFCPFRVYFTAKIM